MDARRFADQEAREIYDSRSIASEDDYLLVDETAASTASSLPGSLHLVSALNEYQATVRIQAHERGRAARTAMSKARKAEETARQSICDNGGGVVLESLPPIEGPPTTTTESVQGLPSTDARGLCLHGLLLAACIGGASLMLPRWNSWALPPTDDGPSTLVPIRPWLDPLVHFLLARDATQDAAFDAGGCTWLLEAMRPPPAVREATHPLASVVAAALSALERIRGSGQVEDSVISFLLDVVVRVYPLLVVAILATYVVRVVSLCASLLSAIASTAIAHTAPVAPPALASPDLVVAKARVTPGAPPKCNPVYVGGAGDSNCDSVAVSRLPNARHCDLRCGLMDGIPIAKSTGLPDRRYSADGRHCGIPIAKSTGLPDRRYSADGRHCGIPIAKSTGLPDRRYSADGRHCGIPIAKSTGLPDRRYSADGRHKRRA
jgi:hypothetical protein